MMDSDMVAVNDSDVMKTICTLDSGDGGQLEVGNLNSEEVASADSDGVTGSRLGSRTLPGAGGSPPLHSGALPCLVGAPSAARRGGIAPPQSASRVRAPRR